MISLSGDSINPGFPHFPFHFQSFSCYLRFISGEFAPGRRSCVTLRRRKSLRVILAPSFKEWDSGEREEGDDN